MLGQSPVSRSEQRLVERGIRVPSRGRKSRAQGACDVFTTDASGLAATRATFENPQDHVLLPEIVSKEPLGPLVRHGDNEWGDVVRWTLNALITAEELLPTMCLLVALQRP